VVKKTVEVTFVTIPQRGSGSSWTLHRMTLDHRWDADTLVVTIPSGSWAGVARLDPATR
jgi:hypothetical protein